MLARAKVGNIECPDRRVDHAVHAFLTLICAHGKNASLCVARYSYTGIGATQGLPSDCIIRHSQKEAGSFLPDLIIRRRRRTSLVLLAE